MALPAGFWRSVQMDAPRLTWARVAEHYADLPGEADHFLALDGNVEVGVVKLAPAPP